MDKTQKGLVDTYLRKRKISIESDVSYYNEYELIYFLSNDYHIKTGLNYNDLIQFLQANPKLFSKINEEELDMLYKTSSITAILNYNGLYINNEILKHVDLDRINNSDLKTLLFYAPNFISKVDVNRFDNNQIEWLLKNKPSLIDNFDLNKLNIFNIHNILRDQPNLKSYFMNHKEMEKYDVLDNIKRNNGL